MDAILGFMNNPLVLSLITVLFGLWVKFHPKAASIPNMLIPYLNALIALLVKLGAPAEAHAEVSWLGMHAAVIPAFLGIGGFVGGLLGAAVAAGWQSIQSALIYEVFLRHPIASTGAKPVPPA